MLIIGLTGRIASGKSVVARELSKLEGFATIDADRIAWETYKKGSCVYKKLVEHFGEGILKQDGEIDRKKLGEIVFCNKEELKVLNRIVHPAVAKRIKELALEYERKGTKVLVVEAALLLESEYIDLSIFDYVIALKVNQKEQIKRLIKRDGISLKKAKLKIKAQAPLKKADYVIDTSGSLEETVAQVKEFFLGLAN
jgi:dephospho-CoA kinase